MITNLDQMKLLNEYLTEENLPLLKDYATYRLLSSFASYLSMDYRNASQEYGMAMDGITEAKTEEQIASEMVQGCLDIEFGKIYVDRYFSSESKADVEDMVYEIIDVYRNKLDQQDWMSDETKEKAKKKLDTMNLKIGYPDEWPTYMDQLEIKAPEDGGNLLTAVLEINRCWQANVRNKIGKPVDKTEWAMTPQTVNAYYNPSANEIVFPAAFLQEPYYSKDADRATNLGGIGMVIGHEITHAFDSNDSQYDENGNYNVWWTDEDYAEFQKRQQAIIDFYSQYEPIEGYKTNGELTLTENIADLGSMSCVCEICGDDMDALQKMFTNYAKIWATMQTEALAMYLLNNDVHSPDVVRTNATSSCMDAFYEAFDVTEGDGMYVAPEDRVGIW